MKVNFAAKRLALALLLVPSMVAQATGYVANGCCPPVSCGYAPFQCGDMTFEFRAGVAPKLWTHDRGRVFAVSNRTDSNLIDGGRLGKFNCFYKLPWTVGFRLGYLLSCNIEAYLEFDYIQANSRRHSLRILENDSTNAGSFGFRGDKLKEFSGYLGGRFYFDRWFCNTTSWFVGAKVGVTGHGINCRSNNSCSNDCNNSCDVSGNSCDFSCDLVNKKGKTNDNSQFFRDGFFRRRASVAGGLNTGFNVNLWCGFSFVFTAEIVASSGPRGNHLDLGARAKNSNVSHFLVHSHGTELTFPVTFGLQYTF